MDNNDISDDLTEEKVKEILNNLKDPQKQPKVGIYLLIFLRSLICLLHFQWSNFSLQSFMFFSVTIACRPFMNLRLWVKPQLMKNNIYITFLVTYYWIDFEK